MKYINFKIMMICLIVYCAGCTSTPPARIIGEQYVIVDEPDRAKNAILILSRFEACNEKQEGCKKETIKTNQFQELYEPCIAKGIKKTSPQSKLIRYSERKDYTNLSEFLSNLDSENEIKFINSLNQVNKPDLDYMIIITAKKWSSDPDYRLGENIRALGIGVDSHWINYAKIEALIYSIKEQQLAAKITSYLTAGAYNSFGTVLFVLPFVHGSSPNVEKPNCIDMGEALGRFLSGQGNSFVE